MEAFNYFQPTEILFGKGRLAEVGGAVARFGKRCLIVTVEESPVFADMFTRAKDSLQAAGVEFEHYSGVIPNPTTESVKAGADMAKAFKADVVLGIGGGSSMDTAKAIAVEATHPGTAWDYLFFKTPPTDNTLPIVAVSTTSGTGSQVTQVSVMTETATHTKSALYNSILYPNVCIVDPELMTSVPKGVTASTGFDVFCHAFESYLHPACSPYIEMLALEAIALVAEYLPQVLADGSNIAAREKMAWSDTLAGLCIANAGVTLPHGVGMTIGGRCPQISHGQALAVYYPEFTRFTYPAAIEKFATMGRIFDPTLNDISDDAAAEKSCEVMDAFLKKIGMWLSLKGLGASEDDVRFIADHSHDLPDYQGNPRIASIDEIYSHLITAYERS